MKIASLDIFLLLYSGLVFATPETFEFWFLSADQRQTKVEYTFSKEIAQNCTSKVGDDCFDPKFGLFPDPKLAIPEKKKEYKPSDEVPVNFISNMDTDSIDCDKSNHFDAFCGKANNEKPKVIPKSSLYEVWVDTSRSMKDVDFPDKNGDCFRKSFITRIKSKCSNLSVSLFETGMKSLGDMSALCGMQGFNDEKRLLSWVGNSSAKKLIIITDRSSLTKTIADFVYTHGGKMKGEAPKMELTGKGLLEQVAPFVGSCH